MYRERSRRHSPRCGSPNDLWQTLVVETVCLFLDAAKGATLVDAGLMGQEPLIDGQ